MTTLGRSNMLDNLDLQLQYHWLQFPHERLPAVLALNELVLQLATRHCEGRLVSLLEGGYDLEATADSVAAHLSALLAA